MKVRGLARQLGAALCLLLCLSPWAQAQRVYDGSGRMLGRVDAQRYYDASGQSIGRVEGNTVYDSSGRTLGRIEGERLYDASGRQIGRTDGLRRMQTIVYFYFFM